MTKQQAEFVFAAFANGAEVDGETLDQAEQAWPGGVWWALGRLGY